MAVHNNGNGNLPPSRARTIAAFIVLLAGIGFFLITALDQPLFGTDTGLEKPAYLLLGVACYVLFGLKFPDILDRGGK